VRWLQDPQGNYLGGTGMYFTSKDFVKFGELALNDGVYQDLQLVPENWFDAATTITEPVLPDEWGALTNRSYGLLWWKGKIQDYDVNLAIGHGGQIIVIFPQLDMVIYISSDPNVSYNISDEHEKTILNFIADFIIPAIRE
jgi:CubicO group peptidase (beta-lactamase class C family)